MQDIIWFKEDLENILEQKIHSDNQFFGKIVFNSNHIRKNDIFIALEIGSGKSYKYIGHALENGASLVITYRYNDNVSKQLQIKVDEPFKVLKQLAEFKRNKIQSKIVAITGSIGKTTTKHIVNQILLDYYKKDIFTYEENYNNYIGIPIMLSSAPYNTKIGVFEIGMKNNNSISPLSCMLKPDIAIITNISQAHIGNFQSLKAIVDTKLEIIHGMKKDGIILLPSFGPYKEYMKDKIKLLGFNNILYFGSNENDDIICSNKKNIDFGSEFDLQIGNISLHCKNNFIGSGNINNICASILCSKILSVNLNDTIKKIESIFPIKGRGEISDIILHNKSMKLIDKSYNASLQSMQESLKNLESLKGEKTLFLGDMLDLGEKSQKYHKKLLQNILDVNPKKLILIGHEMELLYKIISKYHNINSHHYFEVNDNLLSEIHQLIDNDTSIIFAQGSNGMKLYNITNQLINVN